MESHSSDSVTPPRSAKRRDDGGDGAVERCSCGAVGKPPASDRQQAIDDLERHHGRTPMRHRAGSLRRFVSVRRRRTSPQPRRRQAGMFLCECSPRQAPASRLQIVGLVDRGMDQQRGCDVAGMTRPSRCARSQACAPCPVRRPPSIENTKSRQARRGASPPTARRPTMPRENTTPNGQSPEPAHDQRACATRRRRSCRTCRGTRSARSRRPRCASFARWRRRCAPRTVAARP